MIQSDPTQIFCSTLCPCLASKPVRTAHCRRKFDSSEHLLFFVVNGPRAFFTININLVISTENLARRWKAVLQIAPVPTARSYRAELPQKEITRYNPTPDFFVGSFHTSLRLIMPAEQIFSVNPYEGHPSLSLLEAAALWEYAKLAQHLRMVKIS